MSGYRNRRRKLKAHGRGDNRHNPGTAWLDKMRRISHGEGSYRRPLRVGDLPAPKGGPRILP